MRRSVLYMPLIFSTEMKAPAREKTAAKAFAVIFDLDGVIVDNMDYHKKAWEIFIKKYNPGLAIEDFSRHFGRTNKDLIPLVFGRELSAADVAVYGEEKEALYRRLYAEHIVPLPGLLNFLRELKEKHVRAAIATSAPKKNLDLVLDGLEIRPWFDALVDASEVEKGKPDPEIYLKAAQKAGQPPELCIVFEDSRAGIQAGLNAGMRVVGVATTLPPEKLNGTHLVIRDFREITVARLERLKDVLKLSGF